MDDQQDQQQSRRGPLVGLRVIELGSIVAASFAARQLGDLGADVIKVETADNPDPLRGWGQGSVDGHGLWWSVQNRNKSLVTIDLRRPEGQELFRRLCAESDVLVENLRPGTLERWGLGYDALAAVNPGLVLGRISGFGQTGPRRRRPGFAAVAEAVSGMRALNGFPDRPPPRTGLSLGDSIAGLFAVQGILAALHERQSSGLGQQIDVSLVESCLAMMEGAIAEYDRLGTERVPTGTRIPGVVPSNVYRTLDGCWFVIAASQQRMYERLAALIDRGLQHDPRFATHESRSEHQQELEDIVAGWAAQYTAGELDQLLAGIEVAGGPVHPISGVLADEQLLSRGAFVPHGDAHVGGFRAQGVMPVLSRTPGEVAWSAHWTPGADNDETFGRVVGLSQPERDELRDQKVI